MLYQTRPKSCPPLPRSCVMRQPLNMQLACIYQSVSSSLWPSISHGQDCLHLSSGACPNEPPGKRSHYSWPHPFPSPPKAQKASPGFHPLPQRGKDNVCIWAGKRWLLPCHPSAPVTSQAWENRPGCNMGSRKQLSALPTRLKHVQMPVTHPT